MYVITLILNVAYDTIDRRVEASVHKLMLAMTSINK